MLVYRIPYMQLCHLELRLMLPPWCAPAAAETLVPEYGQHNFKKRLKKFFESAFLTSRFSSRPTCWHAFSTHCCCLLAGHSVKLGPGGMEALIMLGAGDMRRTLNILQVRPSIPTRAAPCGAQPIHSVALV